MKNFILATCLGAALYSTPAMAQIGDGDSLPPADARPLDAEFYINASLAANQFSVTEGGTEYVSDMMTAGYLRAGANFGQYFGVEGELGIGFSDFEEDGVSFGVDSQRAIFGVLRASSDQGSAFLRAGYHKSDVTASISGAGETLSGEATDSGFAFGLGLDYYFQQNVGVRADITSYRLEGDINYIGGQLGLVARF